jgi:hypothetical protein
MVLRLHPDGITYFDEWRRRRSTSPEDIRLVADLLEAYAAQDGWQKNYPCHQDLSDPAVVIVELRVGLFVHVLKWTGEEEDEFSLVYIASAELPGFEEPE